MSTVIEQAVRARVVATAAMPTVEATLRYDLSDPYAVRIDFPASATLEGTEVTWVFARDLLSEGLREAAGLGDVRVRPYGYERTVLEFHAPEGMAVVHLYSAELRLFLRRTDSLAPRGAEPPRVDLDRCLAELMGNG
ncbi:SsgA family sporulation/cell division regulator [Streptomyces sp. NPDC007088]|uniref:SsgA family sporulation/cell division regulator n=1 Tax=Streptomyces sp. NPDC007088 TaxID=3364773 RepID=UPI00369FE81A